MQRFFARKQRRYRHHARNRSYPPPIMYLPIRQPRHLFHSASFAAAAIFACCGRRRRRLPDIRAATACRAAAFTARQARIAAARSPTRAVRRLGEALHSRRRPRKRPRLRKVLAARVLRRRRQALVPIPRAGVVERIARRGANVQKRRRGHRRARSRLALLFLPGTGTPTTRVGSLLSAAADMGHHAIALSYASLPTAVSQMNLWCTRPGANATLCNIELHENVLFEVCARRTRAPILLFSF